MISTMNFEEIISDVPMDGEINGHHHIGHIILDCFKRRRPNDIFQLDAATGEKETYGSGLNRIVRLAKCLRRSGFQPGDVLTFSGHNHLDTRIPFFAAFLNGLPVAGIDPLFKYNEIKRMLFLARPKISFCERESYELYRQAAGELGIDVKIVAFGNGDSSMASFMDMYDGNEEDEFQPAYFDTDKVFACLLSTSGSTGASKLAAFTHKNVIEPLKKFITVAFLRSFVEKGQMLGLLVSPVQWITYIMMSFTLPLTNTVILQTSRLATTEHLIDIINKYKPVMTILGPSPLALILKAESECDLTCFDLVGTGGMTIRKELLAELQARLREGVVFRELYGQTESFGPSMVSLPGGPPGGLVSMGLAVFKLVDVVTGEEVTKPYVNGELCYKGYSMTEYYNKPAETAAVMSPDGWIRSGDLLYRDQQGYYYFVERLKMLIKYKSWHIVPPELEEVIMLHPGVLEVGVTSIPHEVDSEWPVACVVPRHGCDVTAQQIKKLVADKLSEHKQLRGGVVFLDALPKTSTDKLSRSKLKEIVLTANRQ